MTITESKIIVCPKCLRTFFLEDGPIDTNQMRKNARRHELSCRLPYSNCVHESNGLKLYCVTHRSPLKEQNFARTSVVTTAYSMPETGFDGWEPRTTTFYHYPSAFDEYEARQPHLFIPTVNGRTGGCVVLEKWPWKKECWTIMGNAWINPSYRNFEMANFTLDGIAKCFRIDVKEIRRIVPFMRCNIEPSAAFRSCF